MDGKKEMTTEWRIDKVHLIRGNLCELFLLNLDLWSTSVMEFGGFSLYLLNDSLVSPSGDFCEVSGNWTCLIALG